MSINEMNIITKVNPKKLATLGEDIYHKELKQVLEPKHKGKIVAIEVESREYFLGDSVTEAVKKARGKYPDKLFHLIKIGYPAVHKRRSP